MVEHTLDTEVRHIKYSKLAKLSAIIDGAKAWKQLMEAFSRSDLIPDVVGRVEPLDLSPDATYLIEQQFFCGKSPTQAILNHWAITGRRRPTIRVLIKYLRFCNLKWAEDYVNQEILGIEVKVEEACSKPAQIQALEPQVDRTAKSVQDPYIIDELQSIVEILNKCQKYSFKSILQSTNGFCHRPYDHQTHTGYKIGEGRFSSVFRAHTYPKDEDVSAQLEIVAAKLLKSECKIKDLANEINLAAKIQHQNILKLQGIALGKSRRNHYDCICLIYPYMRNGSLADCLNFGIPLEDMSYITWPKRLDIAVKVARAIYHLHSLQDGPIIHRDIKTANILVDTNLEPYLGDFTLVRQLNLSLHSMTQYSQNITGTSVYMPPEAFRGDISTKFDTFSFGIVLLELLTGMRPFSEEYEEDLFTHITEKLSDLDDNLVEGKTIGEARDEFLLESLDQRAGEWDFCKARSLFNLALNATESRKKDRPEMSMLLRDLELLIA